ncbi:MAG TPA: prephenate dehydratase [Solirubrobacteraceae bacterium]|jgi:prephenate dehydratase|nr:prephenate dehydratase [Solirubrobacteraceae bacterium]
MRLGHLGPAGTFTEQAARAAADAAGAELVPYATIRDVADAVLVGDVERGLVPIENSLEGTVNATVDALSAEDGLAIVGEQVLGVTQCLIAREAIAPGDVRTVYSHPQGLAQCAGFLREEMPEATLVPTSSTAEAVRDLAQAPPDSAAIGARFAAEAHGAIVLLEGIEDERGNETRFVWLARAQGADEAFPPPAADARWKTSVLFAGPGDDSPGWLVRCLSEFAFRGVNLVRIESRPARRRLGHYVFLVDCEGRTDAPRVAEAVAGLGSHCDRVRVLGSYPAAARAS